VDTALWITQALLAAAFLTTGLTKLTQPRATMAAGPMRWAADVSDAHFRTIGLLEVLGAQVSTGCPRCGLTIEPRARWLTIEHCPRCLARARIPVRMFSSPLSSAELYADGSAPRPEKGGGRSGRARPH
jgi:DoxX-like family